MNILRFLTRQYSNFKLRQNNVVIEGKGIVLNAKCGNLGKGNVISIEAGASLTNCRFFFKGNHNIVSIACGTHLTGVFFWFEDDKNRIEIGRMVSVEEGLILEAHESKRICIGDDCMFSYNVHLRTTDSHSIINAEGKRINYGADVIIGNHVWIGADAMLLKGTIVPDNCVVGARSLVTSSLKIKEGCVVAGMPAKIIKEDINWKRERI